MAKSGEKSKGGATPGKLALIAVLAVVLVGVLVYQFSGSEEPPPPRKHPNVGRPAAARPAAGSTRVAAGGTRVAAPKPDHTVVPKTDRQWPKIALEEVLQHDPFALPTALQPPAPKKPAVAVASQAPDKARQAEVRRQREQALAAIRAQGVQMVFVGKEKRVAIIGDRRVRVGDVFDGFRVTDIGSDGVTLSEYVSDKE
jgi:hypothetical protein